MSTFADRLRKDRQSYHDLIMSEVERIEQIVSEFLVLSKPQAQKFQQENLAVLLQEVVPLLETKAFLLGIQIQCTVEKKLPFIICDGNQMKQIVINLVKNAITAMPNGGKINITIAAWSMEKILLRIADQGCGISQEQLARIGDPFYCTNESGTGLGLMTCYKIIQNHHGSIDVTSKVNEGTVFSIYLSIQQEVKI